MDRIAQLQFGSFSQDAQRATIRRVALRGLEGRESAKPESLCCSVVDPAGSSRVFGATVFRRLGVFA